jgi:hypothetical protein
MISLQHQINASFLQNFHIFSFYFQIHHRMSPSQLREVFHVEHRSLVPNYELVELTHQLTNHHSINKRSINSDNLLSKNKVFSLSDNNNSDSRGKSKVMSKNNHHVKKDLSKVKKFVDYDLKNVQQHNVSFDAFGERLNLALKPTQGLFRDGPNLLKMWHVKADANASQGLFYERVEEVSFCRQINKLALIVSGFVALISFFIKKLIIKKVDHCSMLDESLTMFMICLHFQMPIMNQLAKTLQKSANEITENF